MKIYYVQPDQKKTELLLARLRDTNFELGKTSALKNLKHGTLETNYIAIAVDDLKAAKLESFLRQRQRNSEPSVLFFSDSAETFSQQTGIEIRPEIASTAFPEIFAALT